MTPPIAFVADSQVDEHSRLAEHDRVMEFVTSDAEQRGCMLLVHGGDVYERRSTVRERQAVQRWIEDFSFDVAICGGNHEAAGEVEELADRARSVFACEIPEVRVFGDGADAVAVAFLPWPRREQLRAWLGTPASTEEVDLTAHELLRRILRGLGSELDKVPPTVPRVLVAHAAVVGYRTDPDQPAHVGEGMQLSVEDLMLAGADIVLLGHIHMPQEFTGTRADGVSVPVVYAGSPRRTAYAKGELVPKGYVVVTFDGRTPTWQRIPTPATPMQLIEATWGGNRLVFFAPPFIEAGAEVRLRYEVAADQRVAARMEADRVVADWRMGGAAEVKLDEVVLPVTAARAPEIARATTLAAKLDALRAARGETLDAARCERLAAKVVQLEQEAQAA
jgi:DNA repair exonuclease SbcCD nuclease subunit